MGGRTCGRAREGQLAQTQICFIFFLLVCFANMTPCVHEFQKHTKYGILIKFYYFKLWKIQEIKNTGGFWTPCSTIYVQKDFQEKNFSKGSLFTVTPWISFCELLKSLILIILKMLDKLCLVFSQIIKQRKMSQKKIKLRV